MMHRLLVLMLCLMFGMTHAQNRYWVFDPVDDLPLVPLSSDEEVSYDEWQYEVLAPEGLSERAIARRQRMNIDIQPSDVRGPDPRLRQILEDYGATVRGYSKWLKAFSVEVDSPEEFKTFIEEFPYNPSGCGYGKRYTLEIRPVQSLQVFRDEQTTPVDEVSRVAAVPMPPDDHWYDYGEAWTQTDMVDGHFLHDNAYDGAGMLIAVLDGSFYRADDYGGLARVFDEGRVVATYDFVNNDTNAFRATGTHGTRVFSIMAGDVDGQLVGSAPKASYALLRSEDEESETKVEEDNWIFAMEFADSIGSDIVTSSLGYTTFDSNINYTPADMDGRTAIVTLGAVMAHRKGMVVVASAGNTGGTNWRIVSAPADADSILAVGAVDSTRNVALFSSRGTTADGRVKPDVMAQGVLTAQLGTNGVVSRGNGTSFSAPVIAGFAACFWQANPQYNNYEVMQLIRSSCDRFNVPNTDYGYGIPSFKLAMQLSGAAEYTSDMVFPNPSSGSITVQIDVPDPTLYEIVDLTGRVVQEGLLNFPQNGHIQFDASLANGMYTLRFLSDSDLTLHKVILSR